HLPQGEAFDACLGAEVFHAFFDMDAAGTAQAVAPTVEKAGQARINFDAGLGCFLAQVGASGNFDFFLLVDERHLGHERGSSKRAWFKIACFWVARPEVLHTLRSTSGRAAQIEPVPRKNTAAGL